MFANYVFNCFLRVFRFPLPLIYHYVIKTCLCNGLLNGLGFLVTLVCVAMGRDCCIMSAIFADVMVLICNGACKVSLTLYALCLYLRL